MKYKMYDEMMEQPDSLRKTFESEFSNLEKVSKLVLDADKVYLIGCGSSISTCYSVRDAIRMSSTNIDIEVYTGYEFYYNKKLVEGENSIAIFTSQSGETADTLASLRRANEYGLQTVSISNEPDSSMIKEAKTPIATRCETETAILGTKTYITQLACLYQILFSASDYENKDVLLKQLSEMADTIEELLKTTEYSNRLLAQDFKKGSYSKSLAKKSVRNPGAPLKLSNGPKEFTGIVEQVRSGSSMRVSIMEPEFHFINIQLAGVSSPQFKKDGDEAYAKEAKVILEIEEV